MADELDKTIDYDNCRSILEGQGFKPNAWVKYYDFENTSKTMIICAPTFRCECLADYGLNTTLTVTLTASYWDGAKWEPAFTKSVSDKGMWADTESFSFNHNTDWTSTSSDDEDNHYHNIWKLKVDMSKTGGSNGRGYCIVYVGSTCNLTRDQYNDMYQYELIQYCYPEIWALGDGKYGKDKEIDCVEENKPSHYAGTLVTESLCVCVSASEL